MTDSIRELERALADLKATGADCLDPPRFLFMESMLQRARNRSPAVTAAICHRAGKALVNYPSAHSPGEKPPANTGTVTPSTALRGLSALLNQADSQSSATETNSLAAAMRQQEQELLGEIDRGATEEAPVQELRSARGFRATLDRLGTERRLAEACAETHADPGPLNPQKLVTESLTHIGDLSPAYLNHFINYADTLLWLQSLAPEKQS